MNMIFLVLLFFISPLLCKAAEQSTCYGTTDNGYLENGWQLPLSGKNFSAYSVIGVTAGRNYVHSKVHAVVLDAYDALVRTMPNTVFVYGESGFKEGGKFRPHKTHQNGLSIDFFVPVTDQSGQSVALSTNVFNKFGYGIEFVGKGEFEGLTIDYPAIAQHLLALKASADKQGIKIWRVIFDNDLQKQLFKTVYGSSLKNALAFSTKKPWVRHDEHYHVDFIVPCAAVRKISK